MSNIRVKLGQMISAAGSSDVYVAGAGGGTDEDPCILGVTDRADIGGGASSHANAAASATKAVCKASAGKLYAASGSNPNTTSVFVQIFDALEADVTVGSTPAAKARLCIPPGNGSDQYGVNDIAWYPGLDFAAGITYAVTTGPGNNTAPAAACQVHFSFK